MYVYTLHFYTCVRYIYNYVRTTINDRFSVLKAKQCIALHKIVYNVYVN